MAYGIKDALKFLSSKVNKWSDANFSQNYFHSRRESSSILLTLSWRLNIGISEVIHKAFDSGSSPSDFSQLSFESGNDVC